MGDIIEAVYDKDGNPITLLNSDLIQKQGLSREQIDALKVSHHVAYDVRETAKQNLTNHSTLRMLAAVHEAIETEQQKLWKFDVNPDFHRFFEFPGCKCPKLDNMERLGTPYKIISCDCPIHGGPAPTDK